MFVYLYIIKGIKGGPTLHCGNSFSTLPTEREDMTDLISWYMMTMMMIMMMMMKMMKVMMMMMMVMTMMTRMMMTIALRDALQKDMTI